MTKTQTSALIKILNDQAVKLRLEQNSMLDTDPDMLEQAAKNQHAYINGQVNALRLAIVEIQSAATKK
jgi:hypothetical protein